MACWLHLCGASVPSEWPVALRAAAADAAAAAGRPQAVSRRHWAYKKSHTIQLMLEEEERHVDSLRAQLAAASSRPADSGRLRSELGSAEACCRLLRQQLDSLSAPTAAEPAAAVSAAGPPRQPCCMPAEHRAAASD